MIQSLDTIKQLKQSLTGKYQMNSKFLCAPPAYLSLNQVQDGDFGHIDTSVNVFDASNSLTK